MRYLDYARYDREYLMFNMSQKFIKTKNNNQYNAAYGQYIATAVYDSHFVGTDELAEFIQRQASVKKSDITAVLTALGATSCMGM